VAKYAGKHVLSFILVFRAIKTLENVVYSPVFNNKTSTPSFSPAKLVLVGAKD